MENTKIVLHAPDIPGNAGSIGRTCLALDYQLIMIRPFGFEINEKMLRRAGLDYWKHVKFKEYQNWDEFLNQEAPDIDQLFFFSKTAKENYFQASFSKGCYLIFGSETKGLPEELLKKYHQRIFCLPQNHQMVRSLNLANAATAVAYEALRQSGDFHFKTSNEEKLE